MSYYALSFEFLYRHDAVFYLDPIWRVVVGLSESDGCRQYEQRNDYTQHQR
jgi:hypothetical protein